MTRAGAIAALLSAAVGACAPALQTRAGSTLPCQDRVYVANSYANTLSVIDITSNTVAATIPMAVPYNPILSPDGSKVYVTNGPSGTVSVVDTRTNEITEVLRPGAHATGLAFARDRNRLLVTFGGETIEHRGHVRVIDLTTKGVSPMIEVGRTPERITAGRDGKHAYVVSRDQRLFVVDIDKQAVVGTIPLRGNTFTVVAHPRRDKLYLAFRSDHVIGVIDPRQNKVTKYIDVPKGPIGLDFSADGRTLYVTSGQDHMLTEISVDRDAVIKSTKIGERPGLLRVGADGKLGYIAYSSAKHVGVIELATGSELAAVTTGAPTSLTVCKLD